MTGLANNKVGVLVDDLDPDLRQRSMPVAQAAEQPHTPHRSGSEEACVGDANGVGTGVGVALPPHRYLGFGS